MPESIPDFDLYAVLGVAPDAEPSVIWAAHREAVRLSHPDVAGADDVTAKQLNVARDWLLNPARRARYDAERPLARPIVEAGATPAVPLAEAAAEEGLAEGPGRREAVGCLEVGWWLLLLAFAALIFAVLLFIVAE